MRRIMARLPPGAEDAAMATARRHRAVNLWRVPLAEGGHLLIAHLPNRSVGPLVGELEELGEIEVTLEPQGLLTLRPPAEEAADQVKDVELRSPLEVFLAGLQSIGAWRGFLGYAAAAGAIVWVGLFTDTVYLLTAAMLVAPFAGPAMNLALGTARGDGLLVRRSLGRYFAALGVTVAVAAALSLLTGQRLATPLVVDQSQVSSVAVILPLVAGAAGALNLLQSARSSLVSGAAVGMLVAASLAPPAGVLGIATAIGEWGMAGDALFVLLLQLVGINLAGAAVFRLGGLATEGPRYPRGRRWVSLVSAGGSLLLLALLITVQLARSPDLTRSSIAQRANAVVQSAVAASGVAHLVEARSRFTRTDVPGQEILLTVVRVQSADPAADPAVVEAAVAAAVFARLRGEGWSPVLDVTVVRRAPQAPP